MFPIRTLPKIDAPERIWLFSPITVFSPIYTLGPIWQSAPIIAVLSITAEAWIPGLKLIFLYKQSNTSAKAILGFLTIMFDILSFFRALTIASLLVVIIADALVWSNFSLRILFSSKKDIWCLTAASNEAASSIYKSSKILALIKFEFPFFIRSTKSLKSVFQF